MVVVSWSKDVGRRRKTPWKLRFGVPRSPRSRTILFNPGMGIEEEMERNTMVVVAHRFPACGGRNLHFKVAMSRFSEGEERESSSSGRRKRR